jgi:hypothetical protein
MAVVACTSHPQMGVSARTSPSPPAFRPYLYYPSGGSSLNFCHEALSPISTLTSLIQHLAVLLRGLHITGSVTSTVPNNFTICIIVENGVHVYNTALSSARPNTAGSLPSLALLSADLVQ